MPSYTDFDALLFDLDGTLALGQIPIEPAHELIAAAAAAQIPALVVTNNATQTPQETATRLRKAGFDFAPSAIVTSPQAGAAWLATDYPPGSPILITGSLALAQAVTDVGLRAVTSADDDPVAVIQGLSKTMTWAQLAEATVAVRRGARWVATNADATLPSPRGELPGAGALIATVTTATGAQPLVTGKPERALIDMAVARAGAQRPLMIGDRLETDIAAGANAQVPTLLVLTGASTPADLLTTPGPLRPTYIAASLQGLLPGGRMLRVADYVDDAALTAAVAQILTRSQ